MGLFRRRQTAQPANPVYEFDRPRWGEMLRQWPSLQVFSWWTEGANRQDSRDTATITVWQQSVSNFLQTRPSSHPQAFIPSLTSTPYAYYVVSVSQPTFGPLEMHRAWFELSQRFRSSRLAVDTTVLRGTFISWGSFRVDVLDNSTGAISQYFQDHPETLPAWQ